MTDKEKLKEAVSLLKMIRLDAKMALRDDWDRGDDGFKSQIICIDKFLNSIKRKYTSKFKQTKLDL